MALESNGTVYIVEGAGLHKIGATRGLKSRLSHMRIGCPVPLTLIHEIPTREYYRLEAALHRRFTDSRQNGEWFRLTAENIEWIRTIDSTDWLRAFRHPPPPTKSLGRRAEPLFRGDLIRWRMDKLRLSVIQLQLEGFCSDTVCRARDGSRNIGMASLFRLSDRLGMIRRYLFNFELRRPSYAILPHLKIKIDVSVEPGLYSPTLMAKSTDPLRFYRADLVQWRMAKLGVTVDQLKEEGYCSDTISRLRNGKIGSLRMLEEFANRLGLTWRFLFDDTLTPTHFGKAVRR